jgi:hypothetical protein
VTTSFRETPGSRVRLARAGWLASAVLVALGLSSCAAGSTGAKQSFLLTEMDRPSGAVQNVPEPASRYYWLGSPTLPITVHYANQRCHGNPGFGCGSPSGVVQDNKVPGHPTKQIPSRSNPVVLYDSACYGNYGPSAPPEMGELDIFLVDADGNHTQAVPTSGFCYFRPTRIGITQTKIALPEPSIILTLRSPSEVSLAPIDLARSAGLALLFVVLVAFPGQLFNSTLQENYDEVAGWFGFLRRLRRKRTVTTSSPRAGGPSPLILVLVVTLTAFLASLLDASFGLSRVGLELLLANLGAIAITTFAIGGATAYALASLHRISGRFRVYRGGVVVALASVALSRLTAAKPGYMYGVMVAYDSEEAAALPRHHQGRVTGIAYAVLLALSLLVWLLWTPIKPAAIDALIREPNAPTTVMLVTISAAISTFFVTGIGSLLFGLLPLRFLDGEKLRSWRQVIWAGFFALGTLVYVHVVLSSAANAPNPDREYGRAIALFLLFGVASTAFWAYFRFRPERDELPPTPVAHQV